MIENEIWHDAAILVVDDQEANIRLLRSLLTRTGYTKLRSATNGQDALKAIQADEPDLVLLDLHMPKMNGAEVLDRLNVLMPEHSYLPVLVLTADANPATKRQLLAAGAMDFVTKPFDTDEVLLRVRNLLHTRSLHLHMEARVAERTRSLEAAHKEILERLALAGEFRDDETGQHARRVGDLSAQLAHLTGFSTEEVELIRLAAPLHDLGKIAIPDTVLLKAGKLSDAEWTLMRQHTALGGTILQNSSVPLIRLAEQIALAHHEKWDGSGYPNGIRGEAIPMVARIVAITDVYDALTHDRPYRAAWSTADTIAEIRRGSGSHFDPDLVEIFVEMMERVGDSFPFEGEPVVNTGEKADK